MALDAHVQIIELSCKVGENSAVPVGSYWWGVARGAGRFPKFSLSFIKQKGFTLTIKWGHYLYLFPLGNIRWASTSSETNMHLSFFPLNFKNLFNSLTCTPED